MSEPTGGTPTVTVVICAYTPRRWVEITRAVASVRSQRTPATQTILVIDHHDELLDRARLAFPDVEVVANTGRRGLSGARNTGVALALGDVVAFLDDDASAEPDWLTALTAHYDDPLVLAVGGHAEPDWEGRRPPWLPPEFDWVVGCSFTGQPTALARVRNVIGCNMSFRRAALLGTGGFEPALGRVGRVPVGCEETELCIRLGRRHPNGVVLYEPVARVRHRVTADRATWHYFRRRCFAEGRSKAVVTRLAGTGAGLSSEREYTRRVLPQGVRRELRRTGAGDPAALLRAGAIVAGLAITVGGYLTGRARRLTHTGAGDLAPTGPPPERVLAVELSDGVPALPDTRADGGRYAAARVLVRRDARPLGLVHVDLPLGGLSSAALADLIDRSLAAGLDEESQSPPGTEPSAPQPAADHAADVTVVVPTCGRPELLRRTLDALAALDRRPREIVVVDNAPSRPGTSEVVAGCVATGLPVRYVAEPRRGVAHARNRGLAEATGELVAFVDDDVVVDPHWLGAVVSGFTDDTAAVTGYVLPAELETPAQVWIERFGGFGKGCRRVRFDAAGYQVSDPGGRPVAGTPSSLYPYLPGKYGSGANMAFRTSVLRDLGGFDPVLGSGRAVRAGEDIDVLLRL
ncbi:MAG TPA: glycosyltransferase, partial [Actinoplanes sp.]|nr:glycosyltransferase [Actinoplanes sp.]